MILSHCIDKFKHFFDNANDINGTFTYEASTALNFFDVLIIINNNTILTTVCSKPIDRHSYFDYKSNHPIHLGHSMIIFLYCRLQNNMFRPQRLPQMQQGTHSSLFDKGLPYDYYK